MNEKLSFQNITDALAQKAGVQKKVSETFTKAFFDTIIEALYMGEDIIKVKGLGTFKLVEVESRESVNVSNGERIIIPGYKKVSFVPEDSVVEFLNPKGATAEQHEAEEGGVEKEDGKKDAVEKDDEASSVTETEQKEAEVIVEQPKGEDEEYVKPDNPVKEATEEQADEIPDIENILQTSVPERVETPQNEFAGIDMLISTPESIDEVRQQLAEATAKADEIVEAARKAVEDKLRLQKLLERLEANVVPESMETDSVSGKEELLATDDVSLNETSPVVEDNENAAKDVAEEQDVTTGMETTEPISASTKELLNEDEEKKNKAFERVMQDPAENKNKPTARRKKNKGIAWFISIAVILLAAIIFFLYRTFISIDAVKDVAPAAKPKVEQPKPVKKPANRSDEQEVSGAIKDTTTVSSSTSETPQQPSPTVTDATPSRPSIYVMQKGESLTRISQRFYGTKDSVTAIIRANDFIDPNNIPIGAKIKLP